MSSEVKRYSVVLHVVNDSPFRQTGDSCTRPIRTDVVLANDCAALEAECERLREALAEYDRAFTEFDSASKESRHRMRLAVIKARDALAASTEGGE